VTFALTGAALAAMSLPLVTAFLPAGASTGRPAGGGTTSIGVTSVVPTNSTVPRSTLVALSGTVQTFTPGVSTYTVSSGICTVEVLVNGAAGGNIQGGVAGRGASIKGQFAVAAGATYTITVGAYRGGGAGGLAELNGGASSKIVQNSNSAVIVEAAGGGGDSLAMISRTNAVNDTLPGATTIPGGTYPPAIQVAAVPGKGADASATTAVSPITAAVNVPVINATAVPTSTSIVPKSVSASANGGNTASGAGVLSRDLGTGSTVFIASAQVNVFAGGAGAGGSAASGGVAADGGSAGTNYFPTTTLEPIEGENPETTDNLSAPYALGAAVGGSGGVSFIGNGFLTTGQGVNDQTDGRVTLRQIACSTSGSTLPPLGGGSGTSGGPLLPAAIVLLGAGIGLVAVRRRGATPAADAE
jgi:hypothetical protein